MSDRRDFQHTENARPGGTQGARVASGTTSIRLDEDRVTIESLTVVDGQLAHALRRSDDPEALLGRILSVGTRGVLSMGMGLDLGDMEERMQRTMLDATGAVEHRVALMLEEARAEMARALDPTSRESIVAKTLEEFSGWSASFFEGVDPERANSHTGRLLKEMQTLLGPGGALEERLGAALDPNDASSGLARITELLDKRFTEIREILALERGRSQEAERGTMKGFEFEEVVEESLRVAARQLGATVERTSSDSGDLDRIVGDHVVELPSGARIVVEAKNKKTLALKGEKGILSELDLAMANRQAGVAICVSKHPDAFPKEVGPINVYGRRILVCDDGEGTMLWVALRWAQQLAASTASEVADIDTDAVRDQLARLGQLAERFRSNRANLTSIRSSVGAVHESLGEMRSDLLELADDLTREIFRGAPSPNVVDITMAG